MYAYRDRRQKKRDFRSLWITRINAACRENNISYSKFIDGLNKAGVEVNRKMLSEIAIADPKAFAELVKTAKKGLEGKTVAAKKEAKVTVEVVKEKTAKKETKEVKEDKKEEKKEEPKKVAEKKPAAKKTAKATEEKKVVKKETTKKPAAKKTAKKETK